MNLDHIIRDQYPVIQATRYTPHQALTSPGIRYVVSSEGLWRELRTSWIYVMLPLATAQGSIIPFGSMNPTVQLLCGAPPVSLWRDFMAYAKKHHPNEIAGAFVWNQVTHTWRFAIREAVTQGPAHIDYLEVEIEEGEHIVFDLHSHGNFAAGFSATDDKDDLGSIKIAAVVGNVGSTNTLACRLNAIDQRLAIEIDAQGQLRFIHDGTTLHSPRPAH